jgi:pimeloyl-ACP methyl ester carboxylesterase
MNYSMAFRTEHFDGSDVRLVGDVGGDASDSPVILLHGGGQTRHSWHGAMHRLIAEGYFVINLEARGHGDSDWASDGDYSLDRMVEDLLKVTATLANPPALVGASMGGITALAAVGESDRQIASALILVDVAPTIERNGANRILDFMGANPQGFATLEEAADAVAAYNRHRPRPKNLGGLMKNLRQRGGRLYWHWDPQFIFSRRRMEPDQMAERLIDACAKVTVPTLLVRGLESDIVSEQSVDNFRRHLPALEIYDVAGAGHMVAGDKNDAFNAGVGDFLRRHRLENRSIHQSKHV